MFLFEIFNNYCNFFFKSRSHVESLTTSPRTHKDSRASLLYRTGILNQLENLLPQESQSFFLDSQIQIVTIYNIDQYAKSVSLWPHSLSLGERGWNSPLFKNLCSMRKSYDERSLTRKSHTERPPTQKSILKGLLLESHILKSLLLKNQILKGLLLKSGIMKINN